VIQSLDDYPPKEVSTLTIEILERPILAESGYFKGF
jgi:hypothetical protein